MQERGEKKCFPEEGPSIIPQPMEGLCPSPPLPHPTQKEAHGEPDYGIRFFHSFHASHGRWAEIRDPGSNMNWLAPNCVRNTWNLTLICFVWHTENFIQAKWVRIVDGEGWWAPEGSVCCSLQLCCTTSPPLTSHASHTQEEKSTNADFLCFFSSGNQSIEKFIKIHCARDRKTSPDKKMLLWETSLW